MTAELNAAIRAAGGIVHSDGNIFFTNVERFLDAARRSASPRAEGVPSDDLWDSLESDIAAIPCRYQGDPSYDHDAYWMKTRVLKEIARFRAIAAAPQQAPARTAADAPAGVWRCFHCEEVFTTADAAREHFGPRIYSDPACTINVAEYRRMEEAHQRHCEEDTELHRQIHALAGRVDPQEVRRAEEKGYASGLRDGVNLPADSPDRAALATIPDAPAKEDRNARK